MCTDNLSTVNRHGEFQSIFCGLTIKYHFLLYAHQIDNTVLYSLTTDAIKQCPSTHMGANFHLHGC